MKNHLSVLFAFRHSPQRTTRLTGWLVCALVLGLALLSLLASPLKYLWFAVNGCYAMIACVWAVFHPRALRGWRDVAQRWAFWLAALALPLSFSLQSWAETTGQGALPFRSLTLIALLLFLSVVLFGLLLAFGCMAAAISAFHSRRALASELVVRSGVRLGWYLALIIVGMALPAGRGWPKAHLGQQALAWGFLSLPFMIAWGSRKVVLARQQGWRTPGEKIRDRVQHLGNRLVVHTWWSGEPHHLDFRGVAIGVVVVLLMQLPPVRYLLAPLESSALVSMIAARSAETQGVDPANGASNSQTYGLIGALSLDTERDHEVWKQRRRIVLMDMDPELRLQALRTRSEAAIQADIIQALKRLGATRIVLPLPRLQREHPESTLPDAPRFSEEDAARTLADIPKLADAMHAAGNVVLAIPKEPRLSELLTPLSPEAKAARQRLMTNAVAWGSLNLPSFGSPKLPVVPLQASDRVATVPEILLRQRDAPALSAAVVKAGPGDSWSRDTLRFSVVEDGEKAVLVDFRSRYAAHDFPRVSYTHLLSTDPTLTTQRLYTPPLQTLDGDTLVERKFPRPWEFWRNKIVFLDSLVPQTQPTPLGDLTRRDVLAYATATLLANSATRPLGSGVAFLAMLASALMMGWQCLHRTPLEAIWRVALLIFFWSFVALALFFGSSMGWWFDPAAPITAGLVTAVLTTQFTFSHERKRHRDLLNRFVAPDVVETMLNRPWEMPELGGERLEVCILFADARSFTPFSERHSPQQVVETVNEYMTALTDAMHAHGGVLDKFTGDGLMAWFLVRRDTEHALAESERGIRDTKQTRRRRKNNREPELLAPCREDVERENVARAVRAALAMSVAAEQVSRKLMAEGKQPLNMGFGLHKGEAVVGLIGHPRHVNYTALGRDVNISARLQSLAAGGEVIISEAVRQITQDLFVLEAREEILVKGISIPVRPYRVMSSSATLEGAPLSAPIILSSE